MNGILTNPKVAPDLVWRLLDDNAVVVSPGVGEVRVLNRLGTIIWQLLIDGLTVDEIEGHLVAHYDVTRENAKCDLALFFEELSQRGVIVWETNSS